MGTTKSSDQVRIDQLRKELEHHNHLYYTEAKPTISDQEFDRLMRELIDLEKAHPEWLTLDSPSQRVGGAPIDAFVSVRHTVQMMSIDNTYNEQEVREFDERMKKNLDGATPSYVVEPKVDGVSGSLRYENGVLVLAATRGDGKSGDDITAQARTIQSIPLRLNDCKDIPPILEVRGEIFMSNDVFQRINLDREKAGEETYKNPRNLTTGTLKQLDPKITASRKLQFICHGVGQVDPMPATSYWEWVKLLKKWGLPVAVHTELARDVDAVVKAINRFADERGKLPYQTDGMVVKIDSFAQRDQLGVTTKSPRWVIAYKYQAEQMPTVLRDVDWQVGKGGTLTPVARLVPVFLAGTTVSNASLHNIDQIRRLDIHIGDTVVVEKAGEIIPYVSSVIIENRPKNAAKVEPPTMCPSCRGKVERDGDTPFVRCMNDQCPAQFREKLKWFCARAQMDIENVGESLIDQLCTAGLVKTFADLYRLTKSQLMGLERMGDKSAQNVLDSVAGSKKQGLERLLSGMGIRHVGNRVAFVLANQFLSLDALSKASVAELSSVHEIGDSIATSVHDFFHGEAGKHIIAEFKAVGIDPVIVKTGDSADAGSQPFAGLTIVVTGTLKTYTRQGIEELIQKLGGRPSGSVSKKTSFLVAGEEAGSKLEKAKSLGVEILTEDEFTRRAKE